MKIMKWQSLSLMFNGVVQGDFWGTRKKRRLENSRKWLATSTSHSPSSVVEVIALWGESSGSEMRMLMGGTTTTTFRLDIMSGRKRLAVAIAQFREFWVFGFNGNLLGLVAQG